MFAFYTKTIYLPMKTRQILNWMLFALLAFTFAACENEPLEGQFITDDGGGSSVEDGQFIAKINGENFSAITVSADFVNGQLSLVGLDANNNGINLIIRNPGICTFQIEGLSKFAQFIELGDVSNPYITVTVQGVQVGTGSITITELDTDANLISGTFSFTAEREIDDGTGTIITETVSITEGIFNAISFSIQEGDIGDGSACDSTGGGGVDPLAAFFALVNGDEFVDVSFTGESVVVAGQPMVKMFATADNGATMRIDVPEGLGTGTFAFMDPISDGTKLIAIYTSPGGITYTSDVGSGSITISEFGTVTGKIAATFAFVGTDPIDPGNTTEIQVTEGSFNVDYVDNSGGVESSFSADVDAVAYSPTSITVSQAPFAGTTIISVTSVDEFSNQSLTLSFPIDIEAGSYDMMPLFVDGTEKVGLYNPDIGNSILFTSSPGTFTINSYELSSGIIEASFNFTAVDPAGNDSTEYAITNGQFTIQL